MINSRYTPSVSFDSTCGKIDICGRSVLGENEQFLKSLFSIVSSEDFSLHNVHSLDVNLDYFSSKTISCVFEFAKFLNQKSASCEINWHYKQMDQESKETLEDLKEVFPFSVNLIPE